MLHVTGDGKRMYVTNSLLSTMDRSDEFWVKLAGRAGRHEAGPEVQGRSDEVQDRPGRGHDMLLY